MKFRVQIFIPANVFFKSLIVEASNILDAKQTANALFKQEFEKVNQKSGNFLIEQIE